MAWNSWAGQGVAAASAVIIMTAFATVDNAVERECGWGRRIILLKPFPAEGLDDAVTRALREVAVRERSAEVSRGRVRGRGGRSGCGGADQGGAR